MEYSLDLQDPNDLSTNNNIENEDTLKLMNMICGGYVEDDFSSYLSYRDFQ